MSAVPPLPGLLQRYIGAKSAEPGLARRELLLNVMAVGLVLLVLLWVPSHLWSTIQAGNLPAVLADLAPTYAAAGVGLILCLVAYWLSRRGRIRAAGYLLVAGVLGYTVWQTCRWGICIPEAALYFLAVVLAGVLIGGAAGFLVATIALVLYGAVGLFQQLSLHPTAPAWPLLPTLVGAGVVLYIVAILNWVADGLLEAALLRERQQVAELRAHSQEEAQALERLRAQTEEQADLLRDVKALSAPVVVVHDQIIVLPLVSYLDESRADLVRQALLQGIVRHRARFALIDLTGLPLVDRDIVRHLETMSQAGRLLGAEVVFVGLHAQIAAEMIQAGADLRSLTAQRDLQSGIQWALEKLGHRIVAV